MSLESDARAGDVRVMLDVAGRNGTSIFSQGAALSFALPGGTNIHKPRPSSPLDGGWLLFREASYGFLAVDASVLVS